MNLKFKVREPQNSVYSLKQVSGNPDIAKKEIFTARGNKLKKLLVREYDHVGVLRVERDYLSKRRNIYRKYVYNAKGETIYYRDFDPKFPDEYFVVEKLGDDLISSTYKVRTNERTSKVIRKYDKKGLILETKMDGKDRLHGESKRRLKNGDFATNVYNKGKLLKERVYYSGKELKEEIIYVSENLRKEVKYRNTGQVLSRVYYSGHNEVSRVEFSYKGLLWEVRAYSQGTINYKKVMDMSSGVTTLEVYKDASVVTYQKNSKSRFLILPSSQEESEFLQ